LRSVTPFALRTVRPVAHSALRTTRLVAHSALRTTRLVTHSALRKSRRLPSRGASDIRFPIFRAEGAEALARSVRRTVRERGGGPAIRRNSPLSDIPSRSTKWGGLGGIISPSGARGRAPHLPSHLISTPSPLITSSRASLRHSGRRGYLPPSGLSFRRGRPWPSRRPCGRGASSHPS